MGVLVLGLPHLKKVAKKVDCSILFMGWHFISFATFLIHTYPSAILNGIIARQRAAEEGLFCGGVDTEGLKKMVVVILLPLAINPVA